jgi:hypothetical protein
VRLPSTDPTIEISASSGVLRVTVHPARSWPIILFEVALLAFLGFFAYENWTKGSLLFRLIIAAAIASGAAGLMFRWSRVEVIEIDANKITVCKDFRGWERRREYKLSDCREMEWMRGSEDSPQQLRCKSGWGTVTLADGVSETQAIQILTALQQTLPAVAQQLCTHPEGKTLSSR